jgi:hypothetical protein
MAPSRQRVAGAVPHLPGNQPSSEESRQRANQRALRASTCQCRASRADGSHSQQNGSEPVRRPALRGSGCDRKWRARATPAEVFLDCGDPRSAAPLLAARTASVASRAGRRSNQRRGAALPAAVHDALGLGHRLRRRARKVDRQSQSRPGAVSRLRPNARGAASRRSATARPKAPRLIQERSWKERGQPVRVNGIISPRSSRGQACPRPVLESALPKARGCANSF